jgi:hypothetical protein
MWLKIQSIFITSQTSIFISFNGKDDIILSMYKQNKQTLWPESTSELYQQSDRRLSVKLVPTFADRGRHVVSVTNPYGGILDFLDRSCYFFFQVAHQLHYEAKWIPFQIHNFSEKLIVPGIETRPLDL